MLDPFAPEAAPRAVPSLYPGAWPASSCVVTYREMLPLDDVPDGTVPVLSVGSNASPAQLRFKFREQPELLRMPMSRARVDGLFVGFLPGYEHYDVYPATPVLDPGASTELMVQWIEPAQLAVLDATEDGYDRLWLTPAEGVTVTVEGLVLDGVYAYVGQAAPLEIDGRIVRMITPWGDAEPGSHAVATQAELRGLLASPGPGH